MYPKTIQKRGIFHLNRMILGIFREKDCHLHARMTEFGWISTMKKRAEPACISATVRKDSKLYARSKLYAISYKLKKCHKKMIVKYTA